MQLRRKQGGKEAQIEGFDLVRTCLIVQLTVDTTAAYWATARSENRIDNVSLRFKRRLEHIEYHLRLRRWVPGHSMRLPPRRWRHRRRLWETRINGKRSFGVYEGVAEGGESKAHDQQGMCQDMCESMCACMYVYVCFFSLSPHLPR